MFEIEDVLRNKVATLGSEQWLADLPAIVDDLVQRWGLTIDEALTGGTEALVLAVTRADGTAAVLKILIQRDDIDNRTELAVLRAVDGDGCVQLLESDDEHRAVLLERLGPSLYELGWPMDRRVEIMVGCAQRLWRPVPDLGLKTGAEKAQWLIDYATSSWAELDHPLSERALAYAIECAERRLAAHDDETAVLNHGDIHQWNTLQSADGFKLVDPDGLVAEPAYDLGVIVREDPLEHLADPHLWPRKLGVTTGVDPVAIWEWGTIERVTTGFVCTRIDLQPVGRELLATAEFVVDHPLT